MMRLCGTRSLWFVLAFFTLAGLAAAPAAGAAAYQGLQLDSSFPIDVTQAQSQVALDLPASAFAFEPVRVTVEDNPKKATKVVKIEIKLRNNSDTDYFVYGSATLFDAEGKPIASRNGKDKADDDDSATIHMKFKLPYPEAERVKKCALRFSFEKD